MRPLTDRMPKPLIPIADRPLIEYLLDYLEKIQEIDEITVVANAKFHRQFLEWIKGREEGHREIRILNDGSTENENRLGAIGDVQFAMSSMGWDENPEDLLVVAGDHIFEMDFQAMIEAFHKNDATTIGVEHEKDLEELRRCSSVEIDDTSRVVGFVEKPENPKTDILSSPIYIYHRRDLHLVKEFLDGENNSDAPGHFIEWLHRHTRVFAHFTGGKRHDIGNMETYRLADEYFRSLRKDGTA